ncbi:aldo/keto reductase [Novosphingobium sp. JCM 18896]|uniref:aldo/keto reductase n=1 Tax=Novosphingobium sp. JCM 18896 TaxID=2989731 RepID=UPI002222FAA9|nr:aldo/keto reductase [Novosphingobium sp. JCM 18896]MCW1428633.1 aldo/keto reductase [Novosphingobium sp. JCM 18896]
MTAPTPEPVPLGKSGISVSPIAWGMWRFAGVDVATARARIEAALEIGITLFDTADIYGVDGPGFGSAEELFGEVLAEAPGLGKQMVIATKGGIIPGVPYDSSAAYLEAALDASLRRMRLDHVDLWQVHRPDILTHPENLAKTLARMVESGKVRAVGVSNFTAAQVAALQTHLPFPLASVQPEFSPWFSGPVWDGVLDQAMALGTSVLAWSTLGGGRISQAGTVTSLIEAKAEASGVTPAAAAYAWVMAHPARPIPIVGSQQPARIKEAAAAFEVEWTRAEWYEVLQASTGERLP